MSHVDWPDFDVWWDEVLRVAEQEDMLITEYEKDSYTRNWSSGQSPMDAVLNGALGEHSDA